MGGETIGRVREIAVLLRAMDGVQEFDEELFGMLIERIMIINLVQMEFRLKTGVYVLQVL